MLRKLNRVLPILFICWAIVVYIISEYNSYMFFNVSPLELIRQAASSFSQWDIRGFAHLGAHFKRLFLIAVFFYSAYNIGGAILSKLNPLPVIIPTAVGLAVLSAAAHILGVMGFMHKGIILALFLLMSAYCVTRLVIGKDYKRFALSADKPLLIYMSIFGAFCFIGSSLPELFYDSQVYHLAIPEQYLKHGGIFYMPRNFFQPLIGMGEYLYVWLLPFNESQLVRIFTAGTGILAMLGFYSCVKKYFSASTALTLISIVCSIPMFMINLTSTGTEMLALLFVTAAVVCGIESDRDPRLEPIAYLLYGCAIATKLTACFGVPALAAWSYAKNKNSAPKSGLIANWLLLALPITPQLIQNWAFTGNPFYPYLSNFLGHIKPDKMLFTQWINDVHHAQSAGPSKLLSMLWRGSVLQPVGGRRDFFGPAILALTPFLLFIKRERKHLIPALGAAGICLLQIQFTEYGRMFLPYTLLFLLPIACAVDSARLKKTISLFIALCFGANLYWQTVHFSVFLDGLNYIVRGRSETEYLSRTYPRVSPPSNQPGYEFFAKNTEYKKVLIVGDPRSYYCPILSETNSQFDIPLLMDYFAKSSSEHTAVMLRNEGFDGILINWSELNRLFPAHLDKKTFMANLAIMLGTDTTEVFRNSWLSIYRIN
ncbi:MAG: hypothetical protein A2270_10670 [Elusimicrobia bacterium RIFOXYA12_FULL_51_18]|nr:MAG: hypothetical protein A2270_10670 [Elusimicrobia bacterium RIFOXYA12_FULL_51_18]OGS29472.1 MAG: hypothetical protein A2218_00520 [Elusimicrobia bacterium RIFOXYA2_FULL_53_38]